MYRLKAAGVQLRASGGIIRGSQYQILNDANQLIEIYSKHSVGYIAALVGCPIGNVVYHMRRLGIERRSYKDVARMRLSLQSEKANLVEPTLWGIFKVKSKKEAEFLRSLPHTVSCVKYEPTVLTAKDRLYVPDFEVDGEYVEVKPEDWGKCPGVDRRKFAHQLRIAELNGVRLRTWYRSYYDYESITDEDRFFAIDWRLFFNTPDECSDWLLRRGWQHPAISKDVLVSAVTSWMKVPPNRKMDANYPKPRVMAFMQHFHPHFFHSTHKGYTPVSAVFSAGNSVVLRQAVSMVWGMTKSCNIYGLLKQVSKQFRDFSTVGMFKPWVARAVYDKLLGGAGVVVDPCVGWGGRMLACVESEYTYRGSDLNYLMVTGNQEMIRFLGNRFVQQPTVVVADATVEVGRGDLLFTSPPYDDTEIYHGLPRQCSDTSRIYDAIFDQFDGMVALNVPKRHAERVVTMAGRHGWKEGKHLEMSTGAFMIRQKTFEPILMFKK
jgi:hypothetical protein